MRLTVGALLIIVGLPVGIASAATAETKPPLPPRVSVGTPVKFKRNVVACRYLDVRLEHFFDRGDPQGLSSHKARLIQRMAGS